MEDEDGRGVFCRVHWRGVPVGSIQQFRERPPSNSAESLGKLFTELKGKWHDPWGGGDYYETKEGIAVEVIRRYLEFNAKDELVKAMLANDRRLIESYLKWVAEKDQTAFAEQEPED